ncbi:MAG: leucine-rich repeat protein [Ruminococcus sp.]|nr:leucine-rich repeat protein [Candidatus Apopatosoma intestinale]
MSLLKKGLAVFFAVLMCVLAVSCGEEPVETSGSTESTSGSTETTSTETTASSQEDPIVPPVEDIDSDNVLLSEKHGEYLTVKYNPHYCTVHVEEKQGLGSSSTITVSVEMKPGYAFDGFSENKAIANGSKSYNKTSYSKTYTAETTLWVNCSMTYVYHANGGKTASGEETYTDKADVTFYKNPNTMWENGTFVRDGYVLTEYNTAPDGTGTGISLGSRPYVGGKSSIDLYCIWEKETDASDFTYDKSANAVTITGYTGVGDTVVVPAKIEGLPVTAIGMSAFAKSSVKKIVLPSSVTTVKPQAFGKSSLETLVMTDKVIDIEDSVISACQNFQNLRINAAKAPTNPGYLESNTKFDYLLWAKNRKKIVYVSGSSGQFSFVASEVEAALDGEYAVVNLGTNANISGSLWMEMLKSFMNKDDVLLWAPEDGSYLYGNTKINDRFWRSNECNYDILRYINIGNYSGVLSAYKTYQSGLSESNRSYAIFNESVNNNGDLFNARVSEPGKFMGDNYRLNQFAPITDEYLMADQLYEMMENGVRFYIGSSPKVAEVAYDKAKTYHTPESFAAYMDKLVQKYGGTPIAKGEDHVFEAKYFADSAWHMTAEGAHLNTQVVIADLKAQFAKEAE